MRKRGFFESKKGISVMVGYVLLVVFLIIISGMVYIWLKTYIPSQALECSDGTSLFIKEASFDSDTSRLTITLRNNGRFDLAGYFIHAANSSEQELATIDLSTYLDESQAGIIFGNSVLFIEEGSNLFEPGFEDSYFFDIPAETGEPYSIRIIPTRFQESDGKLRFASCSNARTEQIIGEPYVCVPYTCVGLGYVCGNWWSDGCGGTLDCGTCTSPEVCNSSGECVASEECTDTCETYNYDCGNWTICGDVTDCGTCEAEYTCNATGQCESNVNNGVCDPEETCADADCEGQQNGCVENYICQSGSCVLDIPPTVDNCADYCVFLGNYTSGNCRQNPAQCTVNGEIYESGGDQYCLVGVTNNCCCVPT